MLRLSAALLVSLAAAACPGGVRISAETAEDEPSDVADTNLVPQEALGVYQPSGRTLSGHPTYSKAASGTTVQQWFYYSADLGSWLVSAQVGSIEGTALRVTSDAFTPDLIPANAEWSGRWPLVPGIHVRCAVSAGAGSAASARSCPYVTVGGLSASNPGARAVGTYRRIHTKTGHTIYAKSGDRWPVFIYHIHDEMAGTGLWVISKEVGRCCGAHDLAVQSNTANPWQVTTQWSGANGPTPGLRVCCGTSASCPPPMQPSRLSTGQLLSQSGVSMPGGGGGGGDGGGGGSGGGGGGRLVGRGGGG